MSDDITTDGCLNETDTAKLLAVSVHTLRSWRQRNVGPNFLKLGARVVYRRSAIVMFMDASEHRTRDGAGSVTEFQPRRRNSRRAS